MVILASQVLSRHDGAAKRDRLKPRQQVRAIFDTGTGVMPDLTGKENAFLLGRLFFSRSQGLEKNSE
jgi:ABC-type polysaccharide/polyol phosphate transport system ATPase subunit